MIYEFTQLSTDYGLQPLRSLPDKQSQVITTVLIIDDDAMETYSVAQLKRFDLMHTMIFHRNKEGIWERKLHLKYAFWVTLVLWQVMCMLTDISLKSYPS